MRHPELVSGSHGNCKEMLKQVQHDNNKNYLYYPLIINSVFCDQTTIKLIAGKGGDGLVSFRHQKFIPKGGPDGGDGGDGGNIYFKVNAAVNTLSYFNRYKKFKADNGKPGQKECCKGQRGKDLSLEIPPGTLICNKATNELLWDTAEVDFNEKLLMVEGGRSGFGNAHYTTPTRQAPRIAQLGLPGEEKELKLELKLIADVAIIGLPNVGKSTLIKAISGAKPKIADYHFTTLIPNLGVVEHKGKSFVASDIPGLIKGASKGKGLGDDFLKHIERTRLLIHIIDATTDNFYKDFEDIRKELKDFNSVLFDYPYLLAINKIDLIDKKDLDLKLKEFSKKFALTKADGRPFLISAATKKGVDKLLDQVITKLSQIKKQPLVKRAEEKEYKIFKPHEDLDSGFQVKKENNYFVLEGKKAEETVLQTDLENPLAIEDMLFRLDKLGVIKALKDAGVKEGDKVKIRKKIWRFRK